MVDGSERSGGPGKPPHVDIAPSQGQPRALAVHRNGSQPGRHARWPDMTWIALSARIECRDGRPRGRRFALPPATMVEAFGLISDAPEETPNSAGSPRKNRLSPPTKMSRVGNSLCSPASSEG